jgi:hypothetical protein
MSGMEVRFHRLSAQEYRDARRWYERRRAGLGDEFKAAVDRAVERMAAQPGRWPAFRDRYRRVRLGRFPYALYYHIIDPDPLLSHYTTLSRVNQVFPARQDLA